MVRRCVDPRHLQTAIYDAIADHQSNEAALLAYVTAVFESSASINLYSVLLGKSNVHAERNAAYIEEIENLTEHLVALLADQAGIAATHPDAAKW